LQYHLTILRSDFRGTVLNERAVWWLGGLRNIAVAGGSVELRKYSRTMNRMWAATQRRNRIRKNSATSYPDNPDTLVLPSATVLKR